MELENKRWFYYSEQSTSFYYLVFTIPVNLFKKDNPSLATSSRDRMGQVFIVSLVL
jgi:hypothetical protein